MWIALALITGLAGAQGAGPVTALPKLAPIKLCNGGATILARDQCPPPLHSSKVDHGLRAELLIVLDCHRPPSPASEQAIEDTLYRSGFDTLNRRRLASGPQNYPVIQAIREGQFVWVTSAPAEGKPGAPSRLFIALYGRPQRPADVRLSRRLRNLAAQIEPTSCRVAEIIRGTNGPSSIWTYDDVAWLTRYHSKDVLRSEPTTTAYRVHPARSKR